MNALAFYAVAALTLGLAALATFLRDTKLAAMALLGTLASLAILFVLLQAGVLAAFQLVLATGGAAGLFHLAYWKTGEAHAASPSEERRYWAGLVSVLAFVLFFRVIAGSDWGTQDFSRLVGGGLGAVPWLALAAFVLVGLAGSWLVARKEEA